ncbi:hypothetical protein [Thermoactinomyces sp. CICC 10522]|uniref:hypothetical protein n=1 Tax=Thermoactinomyces sp. CICC 10522 TaxID=2767427 RepID=UPI0018DD59DF|nr:hypothetical protein [Thermoactinomyces sp. CICC 10522]MBH8605919.1 hypothetical protein [Thermoactinomyces sp. CICC 10522]
MVDSLRSILELLEELNARCKTPIISRNEFKEEYENLNDFTQLQPQISELIHDIKELDVKNIDLIVEKLIHLHLKLSDCIWHIDQIHELVKRACANIRNSLD